MNSSRKSSKTVIVFILAFALLISALMPMMVMGSSNEQGSNTDYQYYSVKSGDTLTRIAKTYGVTISDIMTANNLSSADRIVAGKVLKVPISSSSSNGSSSLVSTRLSLNVVDADVKDILSAIALNAGYTIILSEEVNSTLTINLENMTALKAIDYVTRLAGVTYLKDGNTLMIGSAQSLNTTFIDKTVFSKITLKYITAELLMSKASELGLSSIQMMSTTMDQHSMHVSGYPKEMAKLNELLGILDVSSNIMVGGDKVTDDFSSIDLTYIDANEFNGLLSSLGLSQGIVLGSRPYTLFVYVTGDALRDIKTIKNVVDKPLSGKNAESVTTPPTGENATTTSPIITPPATEPSTSPSGGQPTTPTDDNKILSSQQILANIDVTTATAILSTLGLNVTMYSNSKFTKTYWLLGAAADVQKAIDAINNIDTVTPNITESFTAIDLGAFTASEMIDRLSNVEGLENITYKTTSSPETSHVLIVYATADMMNTVKEVIEQFKKEDLGVGVTENGWVAVEKVLSEAVGAQRIDLLKSLYPAYLGKLEYKVAQSVNKDDGNPVYITYVKTTAETADYIKALLAQMDEA